MVGSAKDHGRTLPRTVGGERFTLLHAAPGSYYRAVTAELLPRGVAPDDAAGARAAVAGLVLGSRIEGRSSSIEVGGRVPGDEIRSQEVNAAVSHFAALPEVRAALLAYQRGQAELARSRGFSGLVMEGRDIGSVIFPDAPFRFFLHADPVERARRRRDQGQQDSIAERDRLDSSRKNAPLSCPPGAVSIDTTHVGIAEVLERIAAVLTGGAAAP